MKQEVATKKVFIRTLGCQMNFRDSEIVKGLFIKDGYKLVDSEEEADIIIFNTCSVRQHAEDRAVNNMALLMKRFDKKIFGLIGCVAQHKKDELFKRLPKLDFICGPSNIYDIPVAIKNVLSNREKINFTSNIIREDKEYSVLYREPKKQAFVNITYGCNNFCSYCIVPYVRGPLVSRPTEDILREVEDLTKQGIKFVILLGQNVNSYFYNSKKYKKVDFIKLLKFVCSIDGIEKINFTTNHPKDTKVELFKTISKLEKIERYLHLPMQSGSNRILKLMNRGYTIERYKKLVKAYRDICCGKLSTDIIVGFPTETDKDFNMTKEAILEIKFDNAYIFKYSPRPPAESSKIKDDVPKNVKEERHKILLDLQKKISLSLKCQS